MNKFHFIGSAASKNDVVQRLKLEEISKNSNNIMFFSDLKVKSNEFLKGVELHRKDQGSTQQVTGLLKLNSLNNKVYIKGNSHIFIHLVLIRLSF